MINLENLTTDAVKFVAPLDPQAFSRPITIVWESVKGVTIAESMLLVGTSDDDWDIMSASMGRRNQGAIDISDIHASPERIFVKVRYAVYDPSRRENRWYITTAPLEIPNKEFGTPTSGY